MLIKTGLTNGVLNTFHSQMTTQDLVNGDWKITKKPNHLILKKSLIREDIMSDYIPFIERFYDKLYNRNFTSILFGGLGLGVLPYLVQSFCTKIDVVEIDQQNIDLITNNTNYLDPKVNIIHDDVFSYTTSETYDVILIDLWSIRTPDIDAEVSILENKYASNVSPDGLLYFPISKLTTTTLCPTC
jgi:hypothetical protein